MNKIDNDVAEYTISDFNFHDQAVEPQLDNVEGSNLAVVNVNPVCDTDKSTVTLRKHMKAVLFQCSLRQKNNTQKPSL